MKFWVLLNVEKLEGKRHSRELVSEALEEELDALQPYVDDTEYQVTCERMRVSEPHG